MKKRRKSKLVLGFIATLLVAGLVAAVVSRWIKPAEDIEFGVTFSQTYSSYLGDDWREVYVAILDDLEIKKIRIPVYWSHVEPNEEEYDFSDIDWMMDEAEHRNAKITLVTGMKVPRWPECFVPTWAMQNSPDDFEEDILRLVEVTVTRYKGHPALERWQVENEPFFPFGICPTPEVKRYYKELELVKTLDPEHEIVRTTSGEQSIWLLNSGGADVLGVSLYRVVYNPVIGYWVFPIPPAYYAVQGAIVNLFLDEVIVSELQAEPWLPPGSENLSLERKYELFGSEELESNVAYAKRTGASEIFLWGVEWWYHLKKLGDDRLWNKAKELF